MGGLWGGWGRVQGIEGDLWEGFGVPEGDLGSLRGIWGPSEEPLRSPVFQDDPSAVLGGGFWVLIQGLGGVSSVPGGVGEGFWGSSALSPCAPHPRDHPSVIKRRFTSVLVVSGLSPALVWLWKELTGVKVSFEGRLKIGGRVPEPPPRPS